MSVHIKHDYYGVPLWLMKDYLTQLGGREIGDDLMEGEGWRAELRKAERRHIGSLSIGGATAIFSGEQETLSALFEKLHWKTLRGGG
ncbi:MAG: DUF1952 domain-containing protein [Caldilinea sp.]